MKKKILVLLIAFITIPGIAVSQQTAKPGSDNGKARGPAHMAYWENDRVVENLPLTEQEVKKLAELDAAHRQVIQDLKYKIEGEREALRNIMGSEDYKATAARDHFKRMEELRTRLETERFDFRLEQRELLGKERYVKLMTMKRRAGEKRWRQHSGGM
jgi:Spy/CpxP family protein refolding chaperone